MTHPIDPLAGFLQSQWEAALAAIRAAHTTRRDLITAASAHLGEAGRYLFTDWDTRVDLQRLYNDFAGEIVGAMRRHLADAGAPLDLQIPSDLWADAPSYRTSSVDDLDQFFDLQLAYAAKCSLVELAHQLAGRYPLDAARSASLAVAARRVFDYFAPGHWERTPRAVVERGGCKVISRELYGGVDWELSHNTRDQLRRLFEDMAHLLAGTGHESALDARNGYTVQHLFARGRYTSRTTLVLGSGLHIVLFKDKAEFHFVPAVLDALQVAIGTHRVASAEAA